ncbi:hypothetical protein [Sorangium sp. So ce117]|uniref:hypothetical protein n=1 Tax=Sorangium sp. So ce117 TaxID=3133277 RepID=UPI003F5FE614
MLDDHRLVATLAENTGLRRKWAVTIVGDHLYIEADGSTLDGEVVRSRLEEP